MRCETKDQGRNEVKLRQVYLHTNESVDYKSEVRHVSDLEFLMTEYTMNINPQATNRAIGMFNLYNKMKHQIPLILRGKEREE